VKHVAIASALIWMAVITSGCTGHATPPFAKNGIVTGFAAPCAGPALIAGGTVRVSANRHGRAVAAVVVDPLKRDGHFKLSLPPGRYVLSAFGSADAPQVVVLHPGEHVAVNFPNLCY
jgi:hypothetical protein